MPKITNFAEQINRAQHQAMSESDDMLCFGLGIDDPKSIFGTTSGLREAFGNQRVFDMPTAENAMTGIGIGAAIAGSRILMTHQRLDFFPLAMDQLVNNAAKWHYMFNGQMSVPITIRLIVGRGWGQGPTHAQNLQAWFAHVPGLKVVVPSRTENVAQQLYQAINDNNPVLFIEHRWLHQQECHLDNVVDIASPYSGTDVIRKGKDLTIISSSYMTIEAIQAAEHLSEEGINCDVIDISDLHDIDWSKINKSVKKTGKVIVCDSAREEFSCSAEIVSKIVESCFSDLHKAPKRIGLPNFPEPTSFGLTKNYYRNADNIFIAAMELLSKQTKFQTSTRPMHDVPGSWFKGPF